MPTGTATRLIRLFKAPAEGAVAGMIKKGERVGIVRTVIVEGDDERWHEVDAKPGHGFVRAKFVRIEDTAPVLSRPAGETEPEEHEEPEIDAGPSEPAPSGREPSGPKWVKRFPTSRSTTTLAPDFRQKCEAFLAALKAAGATVAINATLRPPERAHLMRFAFLIHSGDIDADDVPAKPGVDIEWVHRRADGTPDMARSRAAASAMVEAYDIAFEPSLKSLGGRAISDFITSEVGVTQLLDQHVNRPGHVPETLVKAIEKHITKTGRADPTKWNDGDEAAVLKIYLVERAKTSMTDSEGRAERINDAADRGELSKKRGSFL